MIEPFSKSLPQQNLSDSQRRTINRGRERLRYRTSLSIVFSHCVQPAGDNIPRSRSREPMFNRKQLILSKQLLESHQTNGNFEVTPFRAIANWSYLDVQGLIYRSIL